MPEKKYMERAICLARLAEGYTNPNPMVGAVIVKNGQIIGEGYHRRCGELHAERNAIANAKTDLKGACIYVTLEPCCHYGKTPPCTEAIIEAGITEVVIGSRDPNPLVSGKGIGILREHGITVYEDFMRQECDELNPVFFHFITTKKPYMVMKYAMTVDGKISTSTGESKWITAEKAREHVQMLRGKYSSIMAGIGTVLADDPMLNCRIEGKHQPVRIIADSKMRIPLASKLVQTAKEYRTIVAVLEPGQGVSTAYEEKKNQLIRQGVELWSMPEKDGHIDMNALVERIGSEGIDSCLVEGGGEIHESLMKTGNVDRVYAYIAPKIFGGKASKTPVEGAGISSIADALKLKLDKITRLGDDILLEYEPEEAK